MQAGGKGGTSPAVEQVKHKLIRGREVGMGMGSGPEISTGAGPILARSRASWRLTPGRTAAVSSRQRWQISVSWSPMKASLRRPAPLAALVLVAPRLPKAVCPISLRS
jgi:hypothetical protein